MTQIKPALLSQCQSKQQSPQITVTHTPVPIAITHHNPTVPITITHQNPHFTISTINLTKYVQKVKTAHCSLLLFVCFVSRTVLSLSLSSVYLTLNPIKLTTPIKDEGRGDIRGCILESNGGGNRATFILCGISTKIVNHLRARPLSQ
jgi:hypothetical protein